MSKGGNFKKPFSKGKKGKEKTSSPNFSNDNVELKMVFEQPEMKAKLENALNGPGALSQQALQESVRDLDLEVNKGVSKPQETYPQDVVEEDKESLASNQDTLEEEDFVAEKAEDIPSSYKPSPIINKEENQDLKEKMSGLTLEAHYSRQSLPNLLRSECEELGIPKVAFEDMDDEEDPALPGNTLCIDHPVDLSVESILGIVTMVTRCYRKYYKSIVLSSSSPQPGRIIFQIMKMSDYQYYEEQIGPGPTEIFMALINENREEGRAIFRRREEEEDHGDDHDAGTNQPEIGYQPTIGNQVSETPRSTNTTVSYGSATSQPDPVPRNMYILITERKGTGGLRIPINPNHHQDILSTEDIRDGIKVRAILNRLGLLQRYRVKYDIKNATFESE